MFPTNRYFNKTKDEAGWHILLQILLLPDSLNNSGESAELGNLVKDNAYPAICFYRKYLCLVYGSMEGLVMERLDELLSQKEEIADKLNVLESEFDSGKKTILAAIKQQRFYFFKNKPKVFMDKDTALLWVNLDFFPYTGNRKNGGYPKLKKNEVESYIEEVNKKLVLDGFDGWHVPNDKELRYLIAKDEYNYPFRDKIKTSDYDWYWICGNATMFFRLYPLTTSGAQESWSLVNIWNIGKSDPKRLKRARTVDEVLECTNFYSSSSGTGNSKASIWPCSSAIVPDDYIHSISDNNLVLTENERLEITLNIFTNNNLIPIFDSADITDLYCRLYIERNELYNQLSLIEQEIQKLQVEKLQTENSKTIVVFDYKDVLDKTDIEAANSSTEQYFEAVRSTSNSILSVLVEYRKANESVIKDALSVKLRCLKRYNEYANLEQREKELLENRQSFFENRLTLGLDRLEARIRDFKKEADQYFVQLDESYYNDYGVYGTTELEFKPKKNFSQFLAMVKRLVQGTVEKVEFFRKNGRLIKSIVDYWETWDEEYRLLKTDKLQRLKTICDETDIEEVYYKEWYQDWIQKRFAIEERFLPLVQFVMDGNLLNENENISVAEKILEVLKTYKDNLDRFYLSERKSIHQKNVVQNEDRLLENVETEIEINKTTNSFFKDLTTIIFECENSEERIFLLKWAQPLLDLPLDTIICYANGQETLEIFKNVITEFVALKRYNLLEYLEDCTAFNEALKIREKDFNDIAYRMIKGLEKK